MNDSTFNYDSFPEGYYQSVVEAGNPTRRMWHLLKFERVLDFLPKGPDLSILDVGCFAGTFLSFCKPERFSRQVGVDILEKQIDYANRRFGAPYRTFLHVPSIDELHGVQGEFDCVTIIEVIEHLRRDEIARLFERIIPKLKIGGKLVISTPNYSSSWPVLEVLVNRLSDVSYEEQHLTKFTYFTMEKQLHALSPLVREHLDVDVRTTTHFITPFLAPASLDWAMKLARKIPHHRWHFPFGNLVLMAFTRKR